MRRSHVLGAVLMTMAGLAVPVAGGTLYDFETPAYSGSPTGTSIAGQNGWTTPTGAASVYTYAANAPGLAVNPNGGAQFLGIVQANPNPNTASPASRGRQSLDLSTSNLWMFSYDLIAASPGVTEAADSNVFNFASIPILDNGVGSATGGVMLSQLLIWDTSALNATYTYELLGTDATNSGQFFATPGGTSSAFNHLIQDHWYHIVLVMDLTTNTLTQESITDLTLGGPTNSYGTPTNFFLDGGQNNRRTTTQFGLTVIGNFVNGSQNQAGLDNVAVTDLNGTSVPEPATILLSAFGLAGLWVSRRRFRS